MLLAAGSVAAESPSWRIERGDVHVLVPLMPGGAFTATNPSLEGTLTLEQAKPARLTGEISMDLATIDTGITLRNQHLREKYLQVAKGKGFDRAVLSEVRLSDADGEAFEGRTAFTGVLLLHGESTRCREPPRSAVTVLVAACAQSLRWSSRTSG
jgi:hypothetical protein